MKDDAPRLLPKYALERARSFRQGATKRLYAAVYMFSRALVWYWLHFRIESIRAGNQAATTLLCLVGLRRRTKTAACDAPLVDGVEIPTFELSGGVIAPRPLERSVRGLLALAIVLNNHIWRFLIVWPTIFRVVGAQTAKHYIISSYVLYQRILSSLITKNISGRNSVIRPATASASIVSIRAKF